MKTKLYRQVTLGSDTTKLTTNLEDSPKLKVGNTLTLKDHSDKDKWWTIMWVAERATEKPRTDWNNNI